MSKPERSEWVHFQPIQVCPSSGKVLRVKCAYCKYKGSAHATRLADHYWRYHGRDPVLPPKGLAVSEAKATEDVSHSSEPYEPPPKKPKLVQGLILQYGDKAFTKEQARLAEERMALLQVCPC